MRGDRLKTALEGSLLGLMAGDALGLPYEGLKPRRIGKMTTGPLRHKLVFGKGMVSDDTEHALITAAALIKYYKNPDGFSRNLAWRLRWWFLRLPAGIGMATGRAIMKLWLGFPASHSGVYSAGNGPAMRAPVIGVVFAGDQELMKEFVRRTTVITHTDPRAYLGSLAVAQAAAMAGSGENISADYFIETVKKLTGDVEETAAAEFMDVLEKVREAVDSGFETDRLINSLGLEKGVGGYIYHTVPVVIFLWLKFQNDYEHAMETIIRLGGDTDTTAAILGGVIGARTGRDGIPQQWLEDIVEWPLSAGYVARTAVKLASVIKDQRPANVSLLPGPLIFVRNMIFLCIVLLHGFRRLLPPY